MISYDSTEILTQTDHATHSQTVHIH